MYALNFNILMSKAVGKRQHQSNAMYNGMLVLMISRVIKSRYHHSSYSVIEASLPATLHCRAVYR